MKKVLLIIMSFLFLTLGVKAEEDFARMPKVLS